MTLHLSFICWQLAMISYFMIPPCDITPLCDMIDDVSPAFVIFLGCHNVDTSFTAPLPPQRQRPRGRKWCIDDNPDQPLPVFSSSARSCSSSTSCLDPSSMWEINAPICPPFVHSPPHNVSLPKSPPWFQGVVLSVQILLNEKEAIKS